MKELIYNEGLTFKVEGVNGEYECFVEVLKSYNKNFSEDDTINDKLFNEIVNKEFRNAFVKIAQKFPKISFELTFCWEDEDNGGYYIHVISCENGELDYEEHYSPDCVEWDIEYDYEDEYNYED